MHDRSSRTRLLALALLSSVGGLTAQSPSYTVFGHGCAGTGPDPVQCGGLNVTGGTSNLAALPNEYCYHHKASSPITVIGIRLWTRTFSAGREQVIGIGLYREMSGRPRQSFATSGTMLVRDREAFYTGYFAEPVVIASGESFWVSQFDTSTTRAAGLTSGTAATGTTYWRPVAGGTGTWAATAIVRNPSYQILCEGTALPGRGIPNLTHTGLPRIGQTFRVNLHHAPARPATLLMGVVRQDVDLFLFGAPGCRLLTTLDFILPAGVPTNGALSFPIPVPNRAILKGLTFYNQFYISEPSVNSFQLTTTNGGLGHIGS